jgi:hypothetical protein
MTTILKALQEMERRKALGGSSAVEPVPRERWPRFAALLFIVPLLAITAGLIFLLSSGIRSSGTPVVAPVAVDAPRPADVAPARVPPPRGASVGGEDAPWGRVQQKTAPTSPAAARLPASPPPAASAASAPRSKPLSVVQAPPTKVAVKPQADAPAPSSGGAPRIHVSSIAYSPDVAKRTVTLQIDGGPLTRLHEGESVSGVEVQLILEEAIYVRHGGSIMSVALSR